MKGVTREQLGHRILECAFVYTIDKVPREKNMKKIKEVISKRICIVLGICALIVGSISPLAAQDSKDKDDHSSSAAAANNPLANMTSFQLQDYYAPDLYGLPDESSNTAWLRFVHPFGKVLLRASLPLSTLPTGENENVNGLGDLSAFAAYLMTGPDAPQQYGVGPLVVAPTATNDALGVDGWQAGAAGIYFNLSSPVIQWGGLVTWQTDISGNEDTNLAIVQPLLFLQMGKGAYLRSSGAMTFDIENDDYYVPVGIGIGKVIKSGRTVYNMFFEPQFTILHEGDGYPAFQIFAGIQLQILAKP